jgi:hypothetical protein
MNDERSDLLCLDAPRAEAIRVGQPGVEVAREAAGRASMFSDPTRLMLAEALGEGGSAVVVVAVWIAARRCSDGARAIHPGATHPPLVPGSGRRSMCYDLSVS